MRGNPTNTVEVHDQKRLQVGEGKFPNLVPQWCPYRRCSTLSTQANLFQISSPSLPNLFQSLPFGGYPKLLYMCHHDQHNKQFLWLLSGVHCLSNHIIKLPASDVSVSNGLVWFMQQSSTAAIVCHQFCCYYLHLIVTTYISLKF
jgi:hypothetical protein